jgi:hypothetical protein
MSGISPQQKKDPRKKGARIEKKKNRGETLVEKLHVLKKKEKKERMKFTSCWERLYQKKKKERRSQFPIVQNMMCGLIHTHTSFAFALSSIP